MNFLNQFKTIVFYEYTTTVRSKSFWISIIALPLFFIFIFAISAVTNSQNFVDDNADPSKVSQKIAIIDHSGLVSGMQLPENIKNFPVNEEQLAREKVIQKEFDALIIFPSLVDTQPTMTIYGNDANSLKSANYSTIAQQLFRYGAISKIPDETIQKALASQIPVNIHPADPNEASLSVQDFILPGLFFGIFFMVVFVGGQTLLQSVSEEKENRMLESILSIISARTLILAKLTSILMTTLTQIGVWIVLLLGGAVLIARTQFGGYFSLIFSSTNAFELLWYFALIMCGLFSIAGIMIGIGSLGKSYKDSTQLSSIFITISLFPLFVITQLISEPHGTLAMITSYIPLSSPMVLLLRSAFGLSGSEMLFALLINIVFAIASVWIAIQLFKIGALETGRTIGFRELLKRTRGRGILK